MPAPRANWRRRRTHGVVIASSTPAPNATLEQKLLYSRQVYEIFAEASGNGARVPDRRARHVDRRHGVQAVGRAQGDHERAAADHPATSSTTIAGARVAAFQLPPLPGSQGLPVQFVLETTEFVRAPQHRGAEFPAGGGQERHVHLSRHAISRSTTPQSTVQIDRNKTAQLGLKMSDVGSGARRHARRRLRQLFQPRPALLQGDPAGAAGATGSNTDQLLNYYVGSVNGVPIPLSTVATITTRTIPQSINHFQQLNSATIQGVAAPGVAQADALEISAGSRDSARCRRAMRSITAGCRGNTSRNRAASSPRSDLRSSSSTCRWPLCSKASAIRRSFWCRCRCRSPAR